jgi:hypothetical protein
VKLSTFDTDTDKHKFEKFFSYYHEYPISTLADVSAWIANQKKVDLNKIKAGQKNAHDAAIAAKDVEAENFKKAKEDSDANAEELRKKNIELQQNQTLTKQYNVLKRAVSQSCPTAAGQGMEVSFGKFMSHLKGIRDIEDKVKDRICPFIKDNMIVDSNTQNADNAADDDDSTIDGFRGSILGDCNKYNKDVVSWNMDTLKSGCCGKTCINDN